MFLAKTLLLTSTIGAISLASPAAAGGPESVHLTAVTTQSRIVDVAPGRTALGTRLVASGVLIDVRGRRSGRFGAVCTVVGVAAGRTAELCEGWGSLPEGQLTFAGRSDTASRQNLGAITGGTGRYGGARGEIRLVELRARRTAVTILFRERTT
jgi:hypothetical protein